MASEEQINNQQRLNDLREEELAYIQESEEFIASTISKSAQLADAIKNQLTSIREKTTLDQKVLQFSKQNVDILSKLKVDYQDISKVDKDRKGILDQIQKNNNVINAQSKDLSKEAKEQARAFLEQEKALTDQQKLLAEKINKQEQLERIIKAQEAAGLKVDIADKALLKNAQESTRLQQMKVAGIQAEVLEAGRVADPLAVSLALLKDQNAQLEEAVGYLDEEEEAIINVEKAQGLFNISLGAAGKLLKKAGLESSALYLGLNQGAEAAAKAANTLTEGGTRASTFGDRIKVLGAGIAGTFRGMADEIKAIGIGALLFKGIKGAFNMLGGKVITGFISDLKSKFTEGISYLKDQFFSLNSYIEDAKTGDQFLQQMSQRTAELATNLGVGTQAARELTQQAGKMSASVGMLPEELAATTGELQKAFGTTQRFSDDTVKTMGQLTNLLGLSNEEASEFVKLSQLSGKEASDATLTYKTQIQALKERENIAISEKEVMKEIAKSSASLQLTSRAQGKSLAEAAFHAKKLGLSLAQTEAIGSNLLEFESSIANEMEAELLIGRDLNLDKARQFALNKDIAGVAKEVTKQIGSAAEFGEMNVIQQEALAKSIGVSVDELANMLKTQELLAGTGFDDMNQAQAEFKKLLQETGSEEAALAKMKEMGASDALQDQMRQISLQERRAQQERDIVEAQGQMASAVNKVFSAFNKLEASIKRIKAVIVKQMKPFFDSFGKTVGEGGKAFETMVLPYAKRLGKFMNDVGLRLVDIVKNSGPSLKNIFEGVLKLFSSIYGVVGGVIERLLGVEKTGTGAGSTFESIANLLSSMVDKLENIDVDALTEKIKGFITGVKDTFIAVKTMVGGIIDSVKNSAIGQFLTGDIGGASLAIAPLAIKGFGKGLLEKGSKMNPMFVKQSDTGIFGDALGDALGKRNTSLLKGLKGLSKVTGGKKTVVGRALRNVAAMAGKRGSIGSQVMKGAKGALGKVGGKALGAVGSAAKGIGGKALGALGKVGVKGLLKAIPGVGLIATAGMALFDAAKSAKNAGEIFDKKEGEKVTTGEKIAAGAAGAVSSLTFGLLDTKTTAKAFKAAGDATAKFFKGMGNKLKDSGKKFFKFTKDIGKNIINKIGKPFTKIFDKFKTQIKNIKNLFVGVFSSVWDYIKDTFNRVKELISSTFSNFVDIFKNLFSGDFSGAFDSLKNIFSGVGTFFFDQFKAGFELVKGLLGNVGAYIKDTFSNIFGGVGEKVMGALKSPINGMIGMLNSLITKINEALTFTIDIPGFGEQGITTEIPTIPALAEGGIVEKATVALIGEAGPEAVIPLDKLSSTVESSTEAPSQNVDELKQELQELKQIMSGFVEQMGQVVNRPITVELNGNKVGQALGQDSYRIQ